MRTTHAPNRLINEKSPYLLQHAHNPVDWYPWGQEAFDKALSEDKPVFLSIGYSTCHWCHVMESESFEDKEVAEILNKDFVPVKVDREERPDIDAVYMSVCQALTGSGGWPLTLILTPDKKPVFAGTYFPKRSKHGAYGLIDILNAIKKSWAEDRQKLINTASEITRAFLVRPMKTSPDSPSVDTVLKAAAELKQSCDFEYGGFGTAPKFPSAHNLMFLMRCYVFYKDIACLEAAEKTLAGMYRGGIFDHFGGGFSRYSTDRKWLAPHFEKMLYDNALLTMAYIEAYKITGKELYLNTAERVLEYINKEMTSPDGGFYSAQDADSEGVEGKYYLFSPHEITNLLGEEDGGFINRFYDITESGNFEGKSIPNLISKPEYDRWDVKLKDLTGELYNYRLTRYPLNKDDKILTSWNCLMICALALAYTATGDNIYLTRAKKAMDFILKNLTDKNTKNLLVRYREGESSGNGFLDDYAYFVLALLSLYDATYDVEYLEASVFYCRRMIRLFYDLRDEGFYFTPSGGEKLFYRPKEAYDGAMPSGNSVAGFVTNRLSALTEEPDLTEIFDRQTRFLETAARSYPSGFSFALIALMQKLEDYARLVCVLPDEEHVREIALKLGKRFIPDLTVIVKTPENADRLSEIAGYTKAYAIDRKRPVFYVCKNKTCYPAEYDLDKILEDLSAPS